MYFKPEKNGVAKRKYQQARQIINEQARIDPRKAFQISYAGLLHCPIQEKCECEQGKNDHQHRLNYQCIRVELENVLYKKCIRNGKKNKNYSHCPQYPSIDKISQNRLIKPGEAR
jgi:hypothetical protein